MVLDNLVGHNPSFDRAGPADQLWYAKCSLPVRVLFAPERSRARIWPTIPVRSIVGGVDDDGVLGYAQFIEAVQYLADIAVVIDHGVVVVGLPQPRLTPTFGLRVCVEVHVCGVHPHEKRCLSAVLPGYEI